ncbi:hypothetical protein [Blastomonas sp. SL216]|uniref:hypothetical protein n=1 Tax=Blastomonas sp. SL216 TaxID=2995169 RepID=UPI00237717B2|nr:hypothetical protein OU999_11050 [Blastomonas sp. SL216]
MRKLILTSVASIGLISLGACQSEQADKVEDQAEAEADALENMADEAPTEAQEDALENQADAVEAAGEEKANAMDDNGEIAPSEVPGTTTEKK